MLQPYLLIRYVLGHITVNKKKKKRGMAHISLDMVKAVMGEKSDVLCMFFFVSKEKVDKNRCHIDNNILCYEILYAKPL